MVSIDIPPLRHRQPDIPLLLQHFLERAKARHPDSPVQRFSKPALERLIDHGWPGNVRELEHLVERVVLLGRSPEVEPSELPRMVGSRATAPIEFHGEILPMREMQRRYASWVYEALGARRMLTAERLEVDIKTLARLLKAEPEGDGSDS